MQWGYYHFCNIVYYSQACAIPDPITDTVVVTGGYLDMPNVARYGHQGWLQDLPSLIFGRSRHACSSFMSSGRLVSIHQRGVIIKISNMIFDLYVKIIFRLFFIILTWFSESKIRWVMSIFYRLKIKISVTANFIKLKCLDVPGVWWNGILSWPSSCRLYGLDWDIWPAGGRLDRIQSKTSQTNGLNNGSKYSSVW